MALMRDNASFQDYPVHTQIQLARCMQYQRSVNTNPLITTPPTHGERGVERKIRYREKGGYSLTMRERERESIPSPS